MEGNVRPRFTPKQRAELWDRWRNDLIGGSVQEAVLNAVGGQQAVTNCLLIRVVASSQSSHNRTGPDPRCRISLSVRVALYAYG